MKRFLLVLAACGNHGGGEAKRAIDGGVAHVPAGAEGLAAPAAVIAIAADGTLTVGASGGSWDARAKGPPVPLADLQHAVLEIELATGSAWADTAKSWIASLDTASGDAAAGLDDAGEADVSMTYFEPVGEIEEPTPLVVVDPHAPGPVLANVLDKVGGAIEIDGRLLALAAPWGNPGYSGVDTGDEDRPSIDVMVGRGKLLTGDDFGPGKVIDPDPKLLASAIAGTPTATIDLLITGAATAEDLVHAVEAAHAAAPAQLTGVGATPFGFPDAPAPDAPAQLKIGDAQTADRAYAIALTRTLRRARPQLVTCTASGKVTVSFAIDIAGNLSKVTGAPPCITDVFAHLTVAPPKAATTASVELDYP